MSGEAMRSASLWLAASCAKAQRAEHWRKEYTPEEMDFAGFSDEEQRALVRANLATFTGVSQFLGEVWPRAAYEPLGQVLGFEPDSADDLREFEQFQEVCQALAGASWTRGMGFFERVNTLLREAALASREGFGK